MAATPDAILYDTHMHTPLCKHAVGEPEQYAAAAHWWGLKGIIMTCHNPAPDGWSPHIRMSIDEFDEYVQLVERARGTWADRVDVLLGLESDFVPGMESWLERLHAREPLHYVLGSVHCQLSQWRERFYDGDVRRFQRTYFEHLALAAESGLFDCLAHPDLVKNEFPDEWQPEELLDDIGAALDRVAATGIAMELNTSGLNKRFSEMNPGGVILREMRRRDIPVVVGSDAHVPERVAASFVQAFEALEEAGYSFASYFVERRRVEISIAAACDSLRQVSET